MEFFEIASIAEAFFYNDPLKKYLWASLLIGAFCFAILYIFEAYALFTIARRCGTPNKWMAFVPVLNTYYIGVLSEKNNFFKKVKARYVSAVMAGFEAACIVLGVLYYIASFEIFGGGYAEAVYTPMVFMDTTIDVLDGYVKSSDFPVSLEWAWWMAMSMPSTLMYWVELAYGIISIFVLISFFRTYSSPRYFLFVILSILFPIKAIFMFAVRNNAGKNYGDYLREQQQRKYRMYHEYMGSGHNGYYGNGYNGGFNADGQYGQYGRTPYGQEGHSAPPADPFDGLGDSNPAGAPSNGGESGEGSGRSNDGSIKNDDPFSDF